MLLQLCLYSTELFQFEGAFTQDNGQTRPGNRQIQDVRTAQRRTCQNRSKLVEVLADIVMTYDSNCAQLYVAEPYLLAAQTHKALHHIQAILGMFFTLRARNTFPEDPDFRYVNFNKVITEHYGTIAKIVEGLILADYQEMCRFQNELLNVITINPNTQASFSPQTLDVDPLTEMRQAFKEYGPSRSYPDQSIWHAIAVIFIAFGLEKGERPQVARRLQRRWYRYKHRRNSGCCRSSRSPLKIASPFSRPPPKPFGGHDYCSIASILHCCANLFWVMFQMS